MRTGKQVSTSGEDVALVQKPLQRGHDFFYGGYVHDVQVAANAEIADQVFVVSKMLGFSKKGQEI